MVVADRETVSALGNNSVNLCCRNYCAMGALLKQGMISSKRNLQKQLTKNLNL